MRTTTRTTGALSALALSLVLAACGGGDTGSMDHSSMSSESSTSPPSGVATGVGAEHDDQDVVFAQMMIVHHQGALEMTRMAATRATSRQVQDLAATIEAAQEPEVEQMSSWLAAWGAPASAGSPMSPAHGEMEGMDHPSTGGSATSGMPGTMSGEQMTRLQNATGTDFDRVFLQMMIEHHAGAVQMARTEQQQGSNPQALELAGSIITSQTAEIEQMQQMLAASG